MATKSIAEAKTSKLLHATLPYVIKIPDGAAWGGQPRIDFLGTCSLGHFVGVEVKAIQPRVRAPLMFRHTDPRVMTPAQKKALDSMRGGKGAHLWIMVWAGQELYAMHWSALRHKKEPFDLRFDIPVHTHLVKRGVEWPHSAYYLIEDLLGHGI